MEEKGRPAHWRVALKWARFLGVKAVELAVILSAFASLHDRLETIIVAMAWLRNHFRSAGTTYQGAAGVEHRSSTIRYASW